MCVCVCTCVIQILMHNKVSNLEKSSTWEKNEHTHSKIELKRSKGNTESRRLQIDDKSLTEIRESIS